ncbi:MAG TPA: DUF4388 domain-containing protein [Myxococcota bacterium]|nr:DUF4388 domain-containing protein [Myxococcota bacterium]
MRVLLVSARAEEVKSLGGPLARERFAVALAKTATEAIEALQKHAFDALVLSHPLPDAEPVGSCAALSAVAGCPPILLIDALDRSHEVLGALPADARPARCLVRPLDGAKLPALLRELIDEEREPDASVDRRGFANVLLDLALRGETGVLEIHGEGVSTRVYVRRGAPISVEGGSLRETLGRMLVRSGALSERDYERVIQRMTERVIDNEHQRMGEVLIQLGLMTASDVFQALSRQAAEKIVEGFAAARVELTFDAQDALPATTSPLAVPPFPALLVEAVKRHFSEDEQNALVLPLAGSRVKLRDPAPDLRLVGDDARLAASLNGKRSLSEIWRASNDARATLAALALVDAFAVATPAARAQVTPAPAPRASAKFAREVVAPRAKAAPAASARPVASSPAATSAESDDAPTVPLGRRGGQHTRLEAEQLFQEACKLALRERFEEAAALFQRVVALQPNEPEYRMHEAFTGYLAARVAQRIARAKAMACARKMLETDPRSAKPHTILGRLAWDDGDTASAAREFELALVRDPNDEDAKKGLAQARGSKKAK